jgi:hypothetical protein
MPCYWKVEHEGYLQELQEKRKPQRKRYEIKGQQAVGLYVKLNVIHIEVPLIQMYPSNCSEITFHEIFATKIFIALR